jgi:Putative prokaryotic signal transducing protein
MVVVATFSKPEEAHLLRMRLEAGGIQAFIRDENTIQIDWLYSNALGGVRVEVAEEDEAAARELLAADHGLSGHDSAPATSSDE